MRERLPKGDVQGAAKTIKEGKNLEIGVANVVANAMKDWAVEKRRDTLYALVPADDGHHGGRSDSFITPDGDDSVIMEFSGKELIKASRMRPLSVRRSAGDVRGERVYRMGPDLLCIYKGWNPLHPDRVLLVQRRGA